MPFSVILENDPKMCSHHYVMSTQVFYDAQVLYYEVCLINSKIPMELHYKHWTIVVT